MEKGILGGMKKIGYLFIIFHINVGLTLKLIRSAKPIEANLMPYIIDNQITIEVFSIFNFMELFKSTNRSLRLDFKFVL